MVRPENSFRGWEIQLLQPLRWCCVDCMIHHERDVKNKNMSMWREQAIIEWSWWATSHNACESGEQLIVLANGDDESDLVGWSLLLLAAMVRSFAHMLLGISDRNTTYFQSLFTKLVIASDSFTILKTKTVLCNQFINLDLLLKTRTRYFLNLTLKQFKKCMVQQNM